MNRHYYRLGSGGRAARGAIRQCREWLRNKETTLRNRHAPTAPAPPSHVSPRRILDRALHRAPQGYVEMPNLLLA
jgi:hypothetical protein